MLAALCIGVQFNINKVYGKVSPQGILGALLFPCITTIVGALILLCINLFSIKFTAFGIIMASIGSVISVLSLMVGILATGRGRVSVYTTFMMIGGMFLPYVYGLCAGEKTTVGKILGMVVLIIALVLSILPSKKDRANKTPLKLSFIVLCAIAFMLNGCTAIVSNIHQKNIEMQMGTFDYVITGYLMQFALSGIAVIIAYFVTKSRTRNTQNATLKINNEVLTKSSIVKKALIVFTVCAVFAVVSGGGFLLQLISNTHLDASRLYPFVTGGSTVFGTLIAAIMFKEKLNLTTIISLVLMLGGTILFIF
jgi:multidrug transporter EmrE-like cation transporter